MTRSTNSSGNKASAHFCGKAVALSLARDAELAAGGGVPCRGRTLLPHDCGDAASATVAPLAVD